MVDLTTVDFPMVLDGGRWSRRDDTGGGDTDIDQIKRTNGKIPTQIERGLSIRGTGTQARARNDPSNIDSVIGFGRRPENMNLNLHCGVLRLDPGDRYPGDRKVFCRQYV